MPDLFIVKRDVNFLGQAVPGKGSQAICSKPLGGCGHDLSPAEAVYRYHLVGDGRPLYLHAECAQEQVGFTGTQEGLANDQRVSAYNLLSQLVAKTFHHGDCIGADFEAASMMAAIRTDSKYPDTRIVKHPGHGENKSMVRCADSPDFDETNDPKPFLVRNQDIVDASTVLVACPSGFTEERRSGTWFTVRRAREALNVHTIYLVLPDGRIKDGRL